MKKIITIFLTIIFSLFLVQGVLASQYAILPLSTMAKFSDTIFVGKTLGLKEKIKDPGAYTTGTTPVSSEEVVTFQIIKVIAGNFEGETIRVTFDRNQYSDNLSLYGNSGALIFASFSDGVLRAHPKSDVFEPKEFPEWKIKFYYFMYHKFPIPFSYLIGIILVIIVTVLVSFLIFLKRKIFSQKRKT